MMKRILWSTTILAAATTASFAQEAKEADATQKQDHVVALNEWAYDDLYSAGWTVETMFDETEVIGPEGEQIGDVENVLIGADGQIMSVVVEVGGFWDIGDTHVSVPWDEVTLGETMDEITVPVTEENADDYSIFGPREFFFAGDGDEVAIVDDSLFTGERVFKATELIGDYVYLTGDEEYGYVSDLVFDKNDGSMLAVLVDGSTIGDPGPYAYPYTGYHTDWHPGIVDLRLPYSAEEVTVVDTFDYAEIDAMPASSSEEETAADSAEKSSEEKTQNEG